MEIRCRNATDKRWIRLRPGVVNSYVRRGLRAVKPIRSAAYLLLELRSAIRDSLDRDRLYFRELYRLQSDPFRYAGMAGSLRLHAMADVLDFIRRQSHFTTALEVGCAEGRFTRLLASRCSSLLATDVSDIALERARRYCTGYPQIRFVRSDVRIECLSEQFELIVIAGVLEYFKRPGRIRRVRARLVNALQDGGYLLVESRRANQVIESSWWGRKLIRGKWINDYIAAHPALDLVASVLTESNVITLCQKRRSDKS